MAPYRAGSGSGMFGSSVQADRPGVDYASIVDSLTHGTSSLIQQVYLQKRLQADRAIQDEQRKFDRGQADIQNQREQRRELFDRDKFNEDKRKTRADEIYRGYAEDEHSTTVEGDTIAKALGAAKVRPSFLAPAPMPDQKVVTQKAEPHYDLDKSVPYRIATDRAAVSTQASAARQEVTIAARVQAQERGEQIQARMIRLRGEEARRTRGGAGGIVRTYTEAQKRRFAQEDAIGLLDTFDTLPNALDAAADYLQSADGAPYRESGVTAALLANAWAARKQRTTQGALPLAREGMPADSAVKVVEDVRRSAGGAPSASGRLRAPAAKADSAVTKTTISQAEFDALVARGFKPADVRKKYTVK